MFADTEPAKRRQKFKFIRLFVFYCTIVSISTASIDKSRYTLFEKNAMVKIFTIIINKILFYGLKGIYIDNKMDICVYCRIFRYEGILVSLHCFSSISSKLIASLRYILFEWNNVELYWKLLILKYITHLILGNWNFSTLWCKKKDILYCIRESHGISTSRS